MPGPAKVAAMNIPITFFAPAERVPIEVVREQARALAKLPLAAAFPQNGRNVYFVLNAQRQIVLASENVSQLLVEKTVDQILGLRPGEALECVHADDCAGGCGTSRACADCGAVRAILVGLAGHRDERDVQVTRRERERLTTLDLRIQATPLEHNQERYVLLAVSPRRPSGG